MRDSHPRPPRARCARDVGPAPTRTSREATKAEALAARPAEDGGLRRSGRRRIRTGSVRATELIKRRRSADPPARLPALEPVPTDESDGVRSGDRLVRRVEPVTPIEPLPASHHEPPSQLAQTAKVVSLVVATFLLCAAVALASAIAHQRSGNTEPAGTPSRPDTGITGERALLPDELGRSIPRTGTASAPTADRGAGARTVTDRTAISVPTGPAKATVTTDPSVTSQPVAEPAVRPLAAAQQQNNQLVIDFYRLLPTSPDRAFDLLGGNLLGADLSRFLRAWSTVREIQVLEITERGQDVLAVVRMRLPDGSHLRVQQLLTVANTTPKRIIDAAILSAQRD